MDITRSKNKSDHREIGKHREAEAFAKINAASENKFEKTGTWINSNYPFLCGNPDGIEIKSGLVKSVLEIKVTIEN